jgi:hypothetical protein
VPALGFLSVEQIYQTAACWDSSSEEAAPIPQPSESTRTINQSTTMASSEVIAIIGITGHMGSLIAKHILARSPTARIHGICRNPSRLPATLASNDRGKIFQTDVNDAEALRSALTGAEIAIFATLADNETMVEGQKKVIDACVDVGVKRYMAGDWTLDFRKLGFGEHVAKDVSLLPRTRIFHKPRLGRETADVLHLQNISR